MYTVPFDDADDRSAVIEALADAEIASMVYWDSPVHRIEAYGEGAQDSALAVTNDIAARVLSLVMHPNLTAKEVDRVVDVIAATV